MNESKIAAEFIDEMRDNGKDWSYIVGVLQSMMENNIQNGVDLESQISSFRRWAPYKR